MSWTLHRLSLTGGLYRGFLTGTGEPPALEMMLGDLCLGHLTPAPVAGGWQVEGDMGTAPLTQGTQGVAIRTTDGDLLDIVTVVTGLGAPEDMRAELEALRAEVTILKAAVRRLATGG